jgi:hypothetical protein
LAARRRGGRQDGGGEHQKRCDVRSRHGLVVLCLRGLTAS